MRQVQIPFNCSSDCSVALTLLRLPLELGQHMRSSSVPDALALLVDLRHIQLELDLLLSNLLKGLTAAQDFAYSWPRQAYS